MIAEPEILWIVRTARLFHTTPDRVTQADVRLAVAYAEVDGPWWGQLEEHYLAQLCHVTATAGGIKRSAKSFLANWKMEEPTPLIPFESGMRMLAAAFGATIP